MTITPERTRVCLRVAAGHRAYVATLLRSGTVSQALDAKYSVIFDRMHWRAAAIAVMQSQ